MDQATVAATANQAAEPPAEGVAMSKRPRPAPPPPFDPLLNAGAQCRELGIHRATLYRWEKKGLLPAAIVVNGRRLRRLSELREAMERLRETPGKNEGGDQRQATEASP